MPALTINTDMSAQRDVSPTRPPISPITPPPPNTQPASRQTYTHTSQTTQVAQADPPPQPIDFDTNADAIALKSAISVLQVQRKRAQEDIQRLSRAMGDAVDDPEGFVKDLASGHVKHGDLPVASRDDDSDDEDGQKDQASKQGDFSIGTQSQKAWRSLPNAQEIVRTPPVNWSQYAIVGDSLDKLHKEQVSMPSQGQPATYANGAYDFKPGHGVQEPYRGVAAPYVPGKDRIDRDSKGKGAS